ncbi:Phosphate-repressible phosphate permease pho-4 [Hypsizygus marmoreus]|uniref:Phosphate transporter n=1 Tax=Hypsizygus marmoreus TaxID=39966 RepID=A0A369JA35_HYPMA|nr:Phosphate-repressible phosphate permease pho-4 [Hypsizygus marmoreus]
MPTLHQWDYLFAFGVIFASLDAFNIGANDVANSFATSVSSKSLTMKQACLAAAICEFLGAVLVGARVADTIKNGIIKAAVFEDNAGVQLLAFVCALSVSASWLMIATRLSWPVSTTYSIIAAIAGVGVALGGSDAVIWGWNGGKGLATIFSGLLIAPAISGGFASLVYLFVKYGLLRRNKPVLWTLIFSPFVFFTVTAVLTMSIIYKGAPSLGLNKKPGSTTAIAIIGTSLVIAALSALFWLPYVYCKVVRKDYTIRFYHFFLGPLLWWRVAPEDAQDLSPDDAVPDYRIVKTEKHETAAQHSDEESANEKHAVVPDETAPQHSALNDEVETDPHPIEGAWAEPKNLYIIFRYKAFPFLKKALTYGTTMDIHAAQAGKAGTAEGRRINGIYLRAKQYPNEVEHLFSFVQVLTACTASFAHGSNDVSNAIGPFAVIYSVWKTGNTASSKAPVPVWMLAYGGVMIVIGLATYGYNIMKVLGNKITLHSPSRGFSMELGAAITVILASQYGLPVSTTMCITGATLGVALCNGDIKAVNWRALGWIFLGWILTVPVVGTLAGCLMGIILNAPHFVR